MTTVETVSFSILKQDEHKSELEHKTFFKPKHKLYLHVFKSN